MLHQGFNASVGYGCIPFQQTAVSIVIIVQLGACAGALGWSNIPYCKLKHCMKLGDIIIECEDYCQWSVTISIANLKGYNMSIDSLVLRYKMDPVILERHLQRQLPCLVMFA
ncbi:hypothetical protein FRC10_001231 [Ceratobasidium sp. 414]|nr:hypothetical protein FRC10_001231 [Ceratobasidium sp. 414]